MLHIPRDCSQYVNTLDCNRSLPCTISAGCIIIANIPTWVCFRFDGKGFCVAHKQQLGARKGVILNLVTKWVLILIGVVTLLAMVVTASPSKRGSATQTARPYDGYAAPDFTLPRLSDGQPVSLSQYHGKPLFINFWASWCPPCNAESPELVKAYAKYGSKVVFISINVTHDDTLANVKTFLKKYNVPYPVLLDKQAKVSNEYNVLALPTSLFVNRQGMIVARYSGAIPNPELISTLQRIEK